MPDLQDTFPFSFLWASARTNGLRETQINSSKPAFVELAYGNVGDHFETAWAASLEVFKARFDKNSITYTSLVEIADEGVLLSLANRDIPLVFGILSKHVLTTGTK